MKRSLIILLFALFGLSAAAQNTKLNLRQGAMGSQIPISWGVGAKLGANLAWLSGNGLNTEPVVGFTAGGFVEMKMGTRWALSADLLYSSSGWKYRDIDMRNEASYLIVPLLVNFYPFANFAIKAGVQPSALMAMWQLGTEKTNVTDTYNRFDLAIPVGVSYTINRVVIDARYNIGVTNILSNQPISAELKNSVFTLSIGFRFVD